MSGTKKTAAPETATPALTKTEKSREAARQFRAREKQKIDELEEKIRDLEAEEEYYKYKTENTERENLLLRQQQDILRKALKRFAFTNSSSNPDSSSQK